MNLKGIVEKMSSEEYENHEQIKSLYDCSQGAYMTSKIGDLPLTVEGLRKAVDEITRLNNVEAELQELNMKYYNEAKDLRRELAKAKTENEKRLKANEDFATKHCYMKCDIAKTLVKEFAEKLQRELPCRDYTFNGDTYSMVLTSSIKYVIDKLLKEYEL
jgi:hypothetical protein